MGILKTELTTDPLARGYAAMSDQQAADSLNAVNRTVPVSEIPAHVFFDGMALSEYTALSAENKQLLGTILSMGTIRVTPGQTRTILLAMFPAGSTTRTNLAGLQTRPCNRAEELGLSGVVYSGQVAEARKA